MMDKGFLAITISLFAIVLYSISIWLRTKFTHKKMHKLYFIVPMIIIIGITVALSHKTLWDVENINIRHANQINKAIQTKWHVVENHLNALQQENFEQVEMLANNIIEELTDYPLNELDEALQTLPSDNNIIQTAVDNVIRSVFFRDIINDANDPFVMIIGKDATDSFIFSDFSQNGTLSVSSEFTGTMEQEYNLINISGNRELAEHTFGRLLALDVSEPLTKTMFMQFEGREVPLKAPYSMASLKELFIELGGDVHKTFESLEFYAPYYIFRDQAISGEPRTINRVKTDAKIITVVSVFNYEDVLERDKLLTSQLDNIDRTIESLRYQKIMEERTVLTVGLLLMALIFILLILFWVFTHLSYEQIYKN